ncbi:MAG: hypothetical protein JRI23_36210 [Deltaproteobacteria bacterium]|jgi:hypothetical protein|nr:hypothetical protein [Deltaproteobacteria bacterium]MBW2537794.1 hypothetical protein [Deltaproteobacteria bacterium]
MIGQAAAVSAPLVAMAALVFSGACELEEGSDDGPDAGTSSGSDDAGAGGSDDDAGTGGATGTGSATGTGGSTGTGGAGGEGGSAPSCTNPCSPDNVDFSSGSYPMASIVLDFDNDTCSTVADGTGDLVVMENMGDFNVSGDSYACESVSPGSCTNAGSDYYMDDPIPQNQLIWMLMRRLSDNELRRVRFRLSTSSGLRLEQTCIMPQ